VYGLNNIKSELPILNKQVGKDIGLPHKRLYYENKIKNILFKNGFSEVMTYSLRNKGDIEILKSVAQDKNFLRNNLAVGISEAVQKNIFNMPLLNIGEVRIFEFGNCFSLDKEGNESEWRSLAIGIDDGKKNKNYTELKNKILDEIKSVLSPALSKGKVEMQINFTESKNDKQKENVLEINFDEMIKDLPVGEYVALSSEVEDKDVRYSSFSLMPFIVRDIACWTSPDTSEEDIENIIRENISPLCISINLFDKFEKEIDGIKKRSFAFRLIYQDKEKTLTDEEVNLEADKVYSALRKNGFEIR
jgi:phenylalanyl-tRNA synthetase beta chain